MESLPIRVRGLPSPTITPEPTVVVAVKTESEPAIKQEPVVKQEPKNQEEEEASTMADTNVKVCIALFS
jgi:hypothetical protein